MNIQLSLVLTDITGVTGLAMLGAIIAGERDPQQLVQFRQSGCKHSEAQIAKALTGTWDNAQLFVLEQAVDLFDYYTLKIAECDSKLEQQYQAMESRGEPDAVLPDFSEQPVVRRQRRSSATEKGGLHDMVAPRTR